MSEWSDEETDEPLIADNRNFYKVEKWTKDGSKIERMLYAGSNLDKAREVFAAAIYHRPRIRLTIRQRLLVLEQWPPAAATSSTRFQPTQKSRRIIFRAASSHRLAAAPSFGSLKVCLNPSLRGLYGQFFISGLIDRRRNNVACRLNQWRE